MCTHSQCLSHDAGLLECQVAKRNADQSGGGAAAGRGGLLRPLWQKTEAVPRCNEGTAAPRPNELHCSFEHSNTADTQASALRYFDKELRSNGWTLRRLVIIVVFEKKQQKITPEKLCCSPEVQRSAVR